MKIRGYTEFGIALDRDGDLDTSEVIGEILMKLWGKKQLNLPNATKIKVIESRIRYKNDDEDLPERYEETVETTLGNLKKVYKALIKKPFNPQTWRKGTAPAMVAMKGIGF